MKYYTINPPAILQPYVRAYWIFEGNEMQQPYVYRSLADGCAELVFHYKGLFHEMDNGTNGFCEAAHFHGQSNRHRRFTTTKSFGIFGAYLYPFTILRLLGIPSHVLSNELVDLKILLGNTCAELEEKIMLANNNYQRADILSGFLIKLLLKNPAPRNVNYHAVSDVIHSSNAYINVKDLANQYCLSERQFERNFKECSGFSPKVYLHIIRFQNVIKSYGAHFNSLSELALQCGYYDQSHFIHNFKEFSGFHPKHYFAGGAEGSEYRDA